MAQKLGKHMLRAGLLPVLRASLSPAPVSLKVQAPSCGSRECCCDSLLRISAALGVAPHWDCWQAIRSELARPHAASWFAILWNSKSQFPFSLLPQERCWLRSVFSGVAYPLKLSRADRPQCYRNECFGDRHVQGSTGSNYHFCDILWLSRVFQKHILWNEILCSKLKKVSFF